MRTTIWTPKSMTSRGQSCCKIPYKDYEISIAMDDSCGAMRECSRSDIRVYVDHQDVTTLFLVEDENMLYGDAETLKRVMLKIDELKGE